MGKLKDELGGSQLIGTIVLQKNQYVNLIMNRGDDNFFFKLIV